MPGASLDLVEARGRAALLAAHQRIDMFQNRRTTLAYCASHRRRANRK